MKKTKENTWTQPTKDDTLKRSFDKALPPEVPRPKSQFNEKEEKERPDDATDLRRRARHQLDKLTLALGQTSYLSKPRFAWLFEVVNGLNYPLTVDRYYEPLKLLIDNRVDKADDKHLALKKTLAEKNGFQYFQIKTEDDLNKMLATARAAN